MRIFVFIFCLLFVIFSCGGLKKSEVANNREFCNNLAHFQDSLAFKLCQMYGLDQGVRLSTGAEGKWSFILPVDSLNFNQAIDFIKIHGYPTEELVGKTNFSHECVQLSFTAIMLHNPSRIVNDKNNFQLLLAEVNKGNLDRKMFANMLDKYYWLKRGNNHRVLYGSDFGKPCLETKNETNAARAEIGLEPLEDSEFTNCN